MKRRQDMIRRIRFFVLAGLGLTIAAAAPAAGDAQRGASLFQQCTTCHSLEPGRHMTGPSLAGLWGRRAGTAQDFGRYSDALKSAGMVWNEQTLDRWLKNPQHLVPGNTMTFPGIDDPRARGDLVAYLKAVSEGKATPAPGGGMMMQGGPKENLKTAGTQAQVVAIRYCRDTYRVTTGAGKTFAFWEFNLRFKTDSGAQGPHPGKPILQSSGMAGDRAFVVFASPEEIGSLIKRQCE